MLIPFSPIRYRKYIDRESKRIHNEKARKDLTGFARECIAILNRQVINETMTESECRYMTEMLWKACVHLFGEDEELVGKVQENMKPIIRLTSDDLRDALQSIETSIQNVIGQLGKDEKAETKLAHIFKISLR